MINETKEIPIVAFDILKANILSFIKEDKNLNKEAKRINKEVAEKMKYKKFINILFENKQIRQEIKTTQIKSHQIVTYNQRRI